MSRYDFYLLGHIAAAGVWVGAAFLLLIQSVRAERARDAAALAKILHDSGALGAIVFMPASLAALAFGLLMVVDGPWSFSDLWVVLGLVGYLSSTFVGIVWIGRGAEKMMAAYARDGGMSPAAEREARKVMAALRLDVAILALILTDMALKPSPATPIVLAAMAAIYAGAVAVTVMQRRAAASVQASAAA